MEIVSNIKEFYSGDNLNWVVSSNEYSSLNDYVLKIILLNAVNPKVEFIADGQADGSWKVIKTAIETSNIVPGKYSLFYSIHKSSDGFAKQVASGFVEIKPNITLSQNYDFRTENQKLLDVVRERIAGRITEGMNAFTINGRSVTLMTMTELMALEKTLIGRVETELAQSELKKNGKTNRNKLIVRYTGIL